MNSTHAEQAPPQRPEQSFKRFLQGKDMASDRRRIVAYVLAMEGQLKRDTDKLETRELELDLRESKLEKREPEGAGTRFLRVLALIAAVVLAFFVGRIAIGELLLNRAGW